MLVTHDQAEALSMGREVAVLRAGRLVQTAAPTTLYRAPVDLDVARFVGDAVVAPGHRARGHRRVRARATARPRLRTRRARSR